MDFRNFRAIRVYDLVFRDFRVIRVYGLGFSVLGFRVFGLGFRG
jgi:hypothetical protein